MNTMLRGKTESERAAEMLAYERLQVSLGKRDALPCDKRNWGAAVQMHPKDARVLDVIQRKGPISARDVARELDMTSRDVSTLIQRLKKMDKVTTAEVQRVYSHGRPYSTHLYKAAK
jgi:DNA-binding MarR family transcriptional regulator